MVKVLIDAHEAVELGEFLRSSFPNDGVGTGFGADLMRVGHEAWELYG